MNNFDVENQDRVRIVKLDDTEYLIECKDPYGFWFILNPRPEELSGMYTSIAEAMRQVEIYHNAKKKKAEAIKTIVSTDGKGNKTRIPADPALRNS